MSRVLAVDFDDVLMQTTSVFCRWHNAQFGTSLGEEDFTAWGLSSKLGCTPSEVRVRLVSFYQSVEHQDAPRVVGALEALDALKEHGYTVHILTARDEGARSASEEWLRANRFTYHALHCLDHLPDSTLRGPTKGQWCYDNGAQALIDDGDHNIQDAATLGIPAFLLTKPWNVSYIAEPPAVRVGSWEEILSLLRTSGVLR